jgi:hypothetical protein
LPRRIIDEIGPDLRRLLNAILQRRHRYFFHRLCVIESLMVAVGRSRTICAVFSVNETSAAAVAAGRCAKRSGYIWVGHFPILVGRRPDGYYFPADFHLAYGGQLRDHMVASGVPAETIAIVGSYTYDQHRGRDRAADRMKVQQAFPRLGQSKLVTVLTEILPNPEIELVPVLAALTSFAGVHVVLKVHPDDPAEQFEALACKLGIRDQIDIVKSCDLSQLLAASDLLICTMSNVAIEAAVAGTPTLMCDFADRAQVINFVDEGLCIGCTDPGLVSEMVRGLLFEPAARQQAVDIMAAGLRRFNGPNDGRSTERIVDFVVANARWSGAAPQVQAGHRRAAVEVAHIA